MKTEEYTKLGIELATKYLSNLKEYASLLIKMGDVEKNEEYQFLLSILEGTLLITYVRLNIYNHITATDVYSDETKGIIEALCTTISSSEFLLKTLLPDSVLINNEDGDEILNDINELSMSIQEVVNKEIEKLFSASTPSNNTILN